MFRTVAYPTLMVIAPPGPVAWSPGMPPLSESLRARIRAGAGARVARAVTVLPDPGRRVVGVPVDSADRRGATASARATGLARATASAEVTGSAVATVATPWMRAPWGDVDPVSGVSVRTAPVPAAWLRPPLASRPMDNATHRTRASSVPVHHPIGQRAPVPVPASTRIRRAAMMAFGLLVSLVAVEAAARVGRR